MYLTYSQYQEMGGTLSESQFNRYYQQSASFVDTLTFNRIAADYAEGVEPSYQERLQYLMFELVTTCATSDITTNVVTSKSNDGISESYKTYGAADVATQKTTLVKTYLAGAEDADGVPLLYVGV